jgi:hypothetical protein
MLTHGEHVAGHTTHHVDRDLLNNNNKNNNNTLTTVHEPKDSVDQPPPSIEHDNRDTPKDPKRKAISSLDPDPADTEPEDSTDHNSTAEEAKARKTHNKWKRKQRKRAKMDQWIQAAGLHTNPTK